LNESEAFERLKARLAPLWAEIFPRDDAPYTCVVVPSVSVGADELERHGEAQFYEETLLFFLIRLRNPRARVVYVSSQPIPAPILDYYLHFLAGIPASHARFRLTTLAAYDRSARPLAEKILERPRLIQKIRAAIPDPARAYLTAFRSTPLERRLAVALDIPLNAADPSMDEISTKSSSRRVFREAGIAVPDGAEDLRADDELIEGLRALRERRPGLRRAVLKLNRAYWDEGHAVYEFPRHDSEAAAREALQHLQLSTTQDTPQAFLQRYATLGGVVEELLEAAECSTLSVQLRISPLGALSLTSTHDEIRSGPRGMATAGCRFPATEAYREAIQEAGLRVGRVLADRGLVSGASIEFLVVREGPAEPPRILGSEVNLGVGGATHPLLAVRFLSGGRLDPKSGLFHSPSGRPKYYRATDALSAPEYRGLSPEDLIEILTMHELNYSPGNESGALFYMLGAISELGRVGMLAVGNSREEAEAVYSRVVDVLAKESRKPER
jgi:PGM1 C-terminal domain